MVCLAAEDDELVAGHGRSPRRARVLEMGKLDPLAALEGEDLIGRLGVEHAALGDPTAGDDDVALVGRRHLVMQRQWEVGARLPAPGRRVVALDLGGGVGPVEPAEDPDDAVVDCRRQLLGGVGAGSRPHSPGTRADAGWVVTVVFFFEPPLTSRATTRAIATATAIRTAPMRKRRRDGGDGGDGGGGSRRRRGAWAPTASVAGGRHPRGRLGLRRSRRWRQIGAEVAHGHQVGAQVGDGHQVCRRAGLGHRCLARGVVVGCQSLGRPRHLARRRAQHRRRRRDRHAGGREPARAPGTRCGHGHGHGRTPRRRGSGRPGYAQGLGP